MSEPLIDARSAARGDALNRRAAHQRQWLLWRAQKMAFWVLYDFAGPLILLNLVMVAAMLAPAGLVARVLPGWGWPSAAAVVALLPAVLAGQAALLAALLEEEEFALGTVWRGVAACGAAAYGLFALYGAAILTVGLGVWYYLGMLAPASPLAGYALAGLCGGSGALLAMTFMFCLPALVHQRGGLARALRTSFALVAGHPGLALGLLLLAVAWVLVLLTPPGLLLLSTLPVVALSCSAYELLDRARALESALERGGEAPPGTLDDDNIFLNRGFTDLLFPWKV